MIVFLDKRLLRYQWYRDWQASRSRKRLEKRHRKYAGIETYEPSGVAERERLRHEKLLEARRQQDEQRAAEEAALELLMKQAEEQAKLNPAITQENYDNIKTNPSKYFGVRNPNPTEEQLRNAAFEMQVFNIFDTLRNERYPTQS